MARGWESKSIEDQIDAAEAARQAGSKRALTPAEMERQARRDGLQLSRTRTLNALQGTCDARYRALLERTLAHIDEELTQLDQADSGAPADARR
jgi:hypothetical protein